MKRLLLTLLLTAVAPGVWADVQIVLQDGKVLDCVDVRRDQNLYMLEMADGTILTVPYETVKQVRLIGEKKKPEPVQLAGEPTRDVPTPIDFNKPVQLAGDPIQNPPGQEQWSKPQQLAGDPVKPLTPEEATAVMGEASKFQKGVIDPTWRPESAFSDEDVLADSRSTWSKSVIDPTWQAQDGFSHQKKDVLEGSRSTWSKSVIDNTWKPQDGFKKKKTSWDAAGRSLGLSRPRLAQARTVTPTAPSEDVSLASRESWYDGFTSDAAMPAVNFRFSLSSTERVRTSALKACAETALKATPADVRVLDDPRYSDLPIEIYQARGASGRAVFTVAGGTCRPISGDLRDDLGVRLSRSYAMDQGVGAYDAVLGEAPAGVRLTTAEDKIDYAMAVVSLIDPDVSGGREAALILLEDAKVLGALAAEEPASCAKSPSKRRKTTRKATRKVVGPTLSQGQGREKVRLYTWSSAEGAVVRHDVRLAADGTVAIERRNVASHVGPHSDDD